MVKYPTGNVEADDLLLSYAASLQNLETTGARRFLRNRHGRRAEHIVFRTTLPHTGDVNLFWHGTTFHCLPDILADGLKNPFDKTNTFQEYIEPGVYVADTLTRGGAMWHGIATRFSPTEDHRVPFTRIVLRLACSGKHIAKRSYGDCDQLVFDASVIVVKEVHFFRGLAFVNKGEHILHLSDHLGRFGQM